MLRFGLLVIVVAGCGEAQPLPCDVEAVVADKCGLCHGERTDFGAPMSLTTWDDFHAGAPSGDGITWEVVRTRLDDADNPMPPDGLPPLTVDDRAVLDAWFAADAPPREAGVSCD